jgi:hypothetical protein
LAFKNMKRNGARSWVHVVRLMTPLTPLTLLTPLTRLMA